MHRSAPSDSKPTGSAPGDSVRQASTHDIDEQAALLVGWNQTYNQISEGAFAGSFMEADVGSVQLFREVTSNALHQTGLLPKGVLAVGVPVTFSGRATFCGTPCDGTQMHVFSGHSGFEFYSPRGLDIAGIVLSEEALAAALRHRDADGALDPEMGAHLRNISRSAFLTLRDITTGIFEVLSSQDPAQHSSACVAAMSRSVITAVADAVEGERGDLDLRIPTDKRWRIVRHACEFAERGGEGAVSIEDICGEVGVSRRALQYCFQDTLEMSPAAYLKAVRLNGARRAIKVCGTVTEAAAQWGFWHFGRFAKDYKAMFGELPSETFRRHHVGRG